MGADISIEGTGLGPYACRYVGDPPAHGTNRGDRSDHGQEDARPQLRMLHERRYRRRSETCLVGPLVGGGEMPEAPRSTA